MFLSSFSFCFPFLGHAFVRVRACVPGIGVPENSSLWHAFIHSLVRSLIHEFILSLVRSFIRAFMHSLIVRSFTRPFVHALVHSLVRSFIHSFCIHSLVRSFVRSLIHAFIHYIPCRYSWDGGDCPESTYQRDCSKKAYTGGTAEPYLCVPPLCVLPDAAWQCRCRCRRRPRTHMP